MKDKSNFYYPLLLFLLTVATRIPFTSKWLYHIDSGNYALALTNYNILVHQPHPPGYFLYIMMGKVVFFFLKDAHLSLILISILFSGMTVVAIYFLGKDIYDERVGISAAILAMFSPNLWFHGEVALSYIGEAFFSTLIAGFCWKMLSGSQGYTQFSALALGIGGGFRQNITLFFLPLYFFSIRKYTFRNIILSLLTLMIVSLMWFIPMVYKTGGWEAYQGAFRELWLFSTGGNSVFEKGWENFRIFGTSVTHFLFLGIGPWILIIPLAGYLFFKEKKTLIYHNFETSMFFCLWFFPALLFYLLIFIHPANPGYMLFLLPPLFLLLAASLAYLSDFIKKYINRDIHYLLLLIIISYFSLAFFFSSSQTSYREIAGHDRNVKIMVDILRRYDPDQTVIFTPNSIFYGYRQIMYHLPGYRVYQLDTMTGPMEEPRKIFWGYRGKTFLNDKIIINNNIDRYILLAIGEENMKQVLEKYFIPNGDISIESFPSYNLFVVHGFTKDILTYFRP